MKQRILLASIMLISCITHSKAQITKESVWVGGGVSYYKSNPGAETYDQSDREFSMTPGVGLVVKDNLVVGAEFLYSKYKRKIDYERYPLYE